MSLHLAPAAPATSAASAAPADAGAVGPERLRRVLRGHAAGVTVITLPGPAGFTASSFTSVSLEPPLVSFCLGRGASTAPRLLAADHFAVHLLGSEHADLARRFARSGIDRFAGVRWTPSAEGVPLIEEAGSRLEARILFRETVGDHLLTVGQVLRTGGRPAPGALLHHDGGFAVPTAL
jgi:flavin reductase (DIM6/NTAB) family NADH-FMN oxidoreductase RutF